MKNFKQILKEETINDIHESLKKHYHFDNNSEHQGYLNEYTATSKGINSYHFQKNKNIMDDDEKKIIRTKKLDAALNYHKTPHILNVYCGVGYDPREHKNAEGIVQHPAYLSTSLKKSIANGFANEHNLSGNRNILKICIPKDHPGAYVGGISEHPEEREFILPRNTKMKHLHTEKKIIRGDHIENLHHMEIVNG